MSAKEERRRVGLYPDNRVAPLLKTVGGKSTDTKRSARIAGNKRKSDSSDSDDSPSGDIRSQFAGAKYKSEIPNEDAEPAYVPGSYKGTAFRGGARKVEQARSRRGVESQRSKLVPKKSNSRLEQKPKFKTYAPASPSRPPLPAKPTFKTYAPASPSRPASPAKPTFKTYGPASPSRPASPAKPTFKRYAPGPTSPAKPPSKPKNERPVFNTYGGALNIDPHSDSDPDEQIFLSSQFHKSPIRQTTPPNPNETKCPMCGTLVELSLLLDFAASYPSVDPFAMRIQVQSTFCSHHRRHTAASSAKHPSIVWSELPSRIRTHLPSIRAFLEDPDSQPSHYRKLLAKDITTGRNRTIMQSIMSESNSRVRVPGYYGPRGARVMEEEILDALSSDLREAAVRDVVVSARGVGVYVTFVLVLEVGIRLVMDDLGLEREDARKEMEESAAWGTLVNEELEEEGPSAVEDESDDYGYD
ncbi:hypothetical protein V495_00163 [Pseudogymnoascus sp. VKM F-4514 (FW-929)]|nr:hypothetical protein V495_00163 [Pseudogymnoascus sp. VKM F-4514 (FW-929)]KFY67451.1 hypothetical protein V497_00392 [Pseudogymnoascus sp. VKM F-4516 (FW-969)]